ncbi:hypothetical protein X797_010411 [Metarhizium robertsii]|uniref:Uncharacterized protein n=1 Tax=Metarhizium robertsii TaxID=568076 RepID=A0A0A1UNQ7_9HYPO|nr:hypothetical protein X797_010411 [Metarhizium robertsii]
MGPDPKAKRAKEQQKATLSRRPMQRNLSQTLSGKESPNMVVGPVSVGDLAHNGGEARVQGRVCSCFMLMLTLACFTDYRNLAWRSCGPWKTLFTQPALKIGCVWYCARLFF